MLLPHIMLTSPINSHHKSKKKFCPHKILANFKIKSPHYNEGGGGGAETMESYQNILQTTCFILILIFFLNKEVWNYCSCLIFCIIFEEQQLSCYILLIDQVSLPGCLYFVRYWAICVLQLFVNQVVKLTLFLIKLFLLHDQKVKTKT